MDEMSKQHTESVNHERKKSKQNSARSSDSELFKLKKNMAE